MARIRYIKPDTPLDEELAACSLAARLFFRDLWCHCDKRGRAEDRPIKLKALIFPYEAMDVNGLLNELCPRFLVRYESNGRNYIQVINFEKHQNPHHTERDSEIPPPQKEVLKRCKDGYLTVQGRLTFGGNGNGNGNGKNNRTAAPSAVDHPVDKLIQASINRRESYDDYRLPAGFGNYGRVYVVNIPVDECKFILAKMQPGQKIRKALEWRIGLKTGAMSQEQKKSAGVK